MPVPFTVGQLIPVTAINEWPRARYRKLTAKTVNSTVAETDLLNGEITLAANDLSTDRVLTLTAHGDWLQNNGNTNPPRFKLKLGGTTLLDTNVPGVLITASVTRYGWSIGATIAETAGATNAQSAEMHGMISHNIIGGAGGANFATGEGVYASYNTVSPGVTPFEGWNVGAKDGTGTLLLELTVILPSASANCEVVLKDGLVVIS